MYFVDFSFNNNTDTTELENSNDVEMMEENKENVSTLIQVTLIKQLSYIFRQYCSHLIQKKLIFRSST